MESGTVMASVSVNYAGVSPTASLRSLPAGTVLRVRADYIGKWQHALMWMGSTATLYMFGSSERYATSVERFPALVVTATNGTLRVVDITAVGEEHTASFFDVLVSTQQPPNMTVADFIQNITRSTAAAVVVGVERLSPALAADAGARRASLTQAHQYANQTSGANGAVGAGPIPTVPEPNVLDVPGADDDDEDGFLKELGKYTGIILGIGGLVAIAYFARTFKD